jgi:hypothetical protein
MNRSKGIFTALSVLALALASCTPTPDEIRLADEWLATDCVTGTGDSVTAALLATGTDLEAYFMTAFNAGPSAAQLSIVDTSGRRLYEIVAGAIDTSDALRFPDGAALLATTSAAFATTYVRSYDRAYRSRALAALGVIASNPARAFIDTVAMTTGSDYYWQAKEIQAELLATNAYRIK